LLVGLLDALWDIGRALAGAKLDDSKICESTGDKRIFLHDGFDDLSTFADSQDDPAISRYLSTRDQEIS
jgi:hypothetical protein